MTPSVIDHRPLTEKMNLRLQGLDPDAKDEKKYAARDEKTCPGCGTQLAVITGQLKRGLKLGEVNPHESFGPLPPDMMEKGPDGKVTSRALHKCYVGCHSCGPVPLNHPWQVRLDAEWATRDLADKAKADHDAKMPPLAPSPYRELNPVLGVQEGLSRLEERLDRMEKRHNSIIKNSDEQAKTIIEQSKTIDRLTRKVAELKS